MPARVDAISWLWSNPMPHGNDVLDMAWYDGLTIQACDLGQLYTTDDLNLWLPQNTGTTNDLLALAYLGNRLVAVGANGSVVFSDDAVNFTATNVSTPNGDWLVAVAASTNLFVAVGDEAIVYTSTNGASWKQVEGPSQMPGADGNWLRGAAYGNGTFVAVGEGGYLASSTDGAHWTQRVAPSGFTDTLNWVEWINTPSSTNGFAAPSFIAVSDSGKSIASADGVNWTLLFSRALVTNSLFAVAGDSNSRVIAGDSLLFLESAPDIFTNQEGILPESAPTWNYLSSLTETNSYLVSGEAGMTVEGGLATNGSYGWPSLDASARSVLWQVTAIADLYIAVGDDAAILTSGDGANWTIEAIPETNTVSATNTEFFGVGGSSNLLVAVGTGGTVVLSTNELVTVVTTNADGNLETNQASTLGVIWNPMPPLTTNDLQAVAFFDSQYYLAGGGGTILRSANGQTWTAVNSTVTAYLSGLDLYSGGIVAVGDQGTILTSPDGSVWTQRAIGLTSDWVFRVRNLGGRLVAVGENGTILTSTNGTNWSKQISGTTNWLNDVTLVTNDYYIVGTLGTLLTSTNATNWSPVPIITGNSLLGTASKDGQLIVAGVDGAILRSQIVPFTTPVSFLDFSQADGQNLFLVSGTTNSQGVPAIDQEFTLDSSTNLVNWATGPLLRTDSSGTLLFYVGLETNAPPYEYYRTSLVLPP
jgi:hypothetical protein